jgi:hypothetical protein
VHGSIIGCSKDDPDGGEGDFTCKICLRYAEINALHEGERGKAGIEIVDIEEDGDFTGDILDGSEAAPSGNGTGAQAEGVTGANAGGGTGKQSGVNGAPSDGIKGAQSGGDGDGANTPITDHNQWCGRERGCAKWGRQGRASRGRHGQAERSQWRAERRDQGCSERR